MSWKSRGAPCALRRLVQPFGQRMRPLGRVARPETVRRIARPRLPRIAGTDRPALDSLHGPVAVRADAFGERRWSMPSIGLSPAV